MTENVVFKLVLDPSQYDKTVNELGSEATKADKSFQSLNETILQGAKGLKDVANAKKNYSDIIVATASNVKGLAGELTNVISKDKEFMAVGKQVADAYKKGKIDEVQATKILEDAINKGVDATRKMQVETEKTGVKIKSYRAQIAELKAILPTLQGDEFIKAQAKLANLTDAMGDQQAQIKLLASDTRALDTAMQGLQLGVGIFAGLQGASALFGTENENVQKALLKVNGAMAVLQSLQTIQNTLDKESGFVNSVKLYWNNLFNASEEKSIVLAEANTVAIEEETAATGVYGFALRGITAIQEAFAVSAAAAWGIATAGIGLLVAGIGFVLLKYTDLFEATKKLTLTQQALNTISKETQENSKEELSTIIRLGIAINDTNLSQQERINAVKKYNDLASDTNKIDETQINNSAYIEDAIKRQTDLIIKRASVKAAENEIERIIQSTLKERTALLEEQNKYISKAKKDANGISIFDQDALIQSESDVKKLKKIVDDSDRLIKQLIETFGVGSEDNSKLKEIAKTPIKIPTKTVELPIKLKPKIESINGLTTQGFEDSLKQEISKPIPIYAEVQFRNKVLNDRIEEIRTTLKGAISELGNTDIDKIFGGFTDSISAYFKDTGVQEKAVGILKGLQSVSDGLTNIADNQINKEIARYDKLIDAQKTAVEKARELADKGNALLLIAEQAKLDKLEELRRKEGQKKKAFAIAQATVNTAVGATEAYGEGAIIGPILAALVVALGAVQIGIISSQQFAKGGFTGNGLGQRDETGHIPVGIVHDNEFVLDKSYTTQNRKELEYIHKNRINIADLMRIPTLSFNPILSNYHVNELGELKKEMKEVRNAIKDLPSQMPQAEMHVGIRGLSITTKNINQREKNWKR